MTPTMKRIQLPVIALLFALLAGLSGDAQSFTRIVIMHTNDLHGQMLPRGGTGGMAEVAALVRAANPDLLLDAGDMFTGTAVCDEFEGKPIIEVMNRMGYDAAAVGNHEFDYGIPALRQRVQEADFPLLSANVSTGIEGIEQTAVIQVRGIRFGIIGLTVENLPRVTHPKNLTNVRTVSVVSAVRRVLPELRNRSDFVIILAHIDDEEEAALAKEFPDIRLLIGGHSHLPEGPETIGNMFVTKTGSAGRNLGKLELQFQGRNFVRVSGELLPVQNVRPNPEIASLIKPYADQVNERMQVALGQATEELVPSGTGESPLSNLIADALRAHTGVQVALHNLGGIRARIRQGTVTRGDAFEVMPFSNTVVTMKLTGLQLKRALGRGLMAVSGIRIEYDSSRQSPNRLVSATLLDGTPVRDDAIYNVATTDFLTAGGDGFIELTQGTDLRDSGTFVRDAIAEHIARLRTITPATDGRIRIVQ
jgi:2',3'-cyclic-nucleotide 2'-phosphodiesterase (5'-nucleotidase family)